VQACKRVPLAQTTRYYRYRTPYAFMAWVNGLDLALDSGALFRRFLSDEFHTIDSEEQVPLLQATLGTSADEFLRTRHRSVSGLFLPMRAFFLLLVLVLALATYVFFVIYFWVGGVFVLFEDIAKNRVCSPEIHVWLGLALLQPIINGLCFPRAFDPYCSRILGWILSLGLIMMGANCFTQSYSQCVKETPELYFFVQAYLVFMVATWLLLLLLPVFPFLLASTGVTLPRLRDSARVDSMDSVAFDVKLFCEHADASEGMMPAECCVCCERFSQEKTIKRTPCKHVFHQECLSRWLSVTDSCPVCRKDLKADLTEDPEVGQPNKCLSTSPTQRSDWSAQENS